MTPIHKNGLHTNNLTLKKIEYRVYNPELPTLNTAHLVTFENPSITFDMHGFTITSTDKYGVSTSLKLLNSVVNLIGASLSYLSAYNRTYYGISEDESYSTSNDQYLQENYTVGNYATLTFYYKNPRFSSYIRKPILNEPIEIKDERDIQHYTREDSAEVRDHERLQEAHNKRMEAVREYVKNRKKPLNEELREKARETVVYELDDIDNDVEFSRIDDDIEFKRLKNSLLKLLRNL